MRFGVTAPTLPTPKLPTAPSPQAQLEADLAARRRELERLPPQAAEGYKQDLLKELGVPPGLPISLPSDLTPEGIAKAAVDGGMGYVEGLIHAEFGISISLPRKFTVEELGRAIGSMLPTSLDALVDQTLLIASQAVASTLTSLLAGAGVGSVIPGLGTLVGIGAAFGVMAIKGLFGEEPPPYTRVCARSYTCETPQLSVWLRDNGQTPLNLLAWSRDAYMHASNAYAFEQANKYCQGGQTGGCVRYLGELMRAVAKASLNTPYQMTWPEVEAALPVLENSSQIYYELNPSNNKVETTTYAGHAGVGEGDQVLAQLRWRREHLLNLGQGILQLSTLNEQQTRELQLRLLEEVSRHAVAVQNSQGTALFEKNKRELAAMSMGFQAATGRLMQFLPQAPTVTVAASSVVRAAVGRDISLPPLPVVSPPKLLPRRPPVTCALAYDDWARKNPAARLWLGVEGAADFVALCGQLEAGKLSLPDFSVKIEALVTYYGRAYRRRANPVAAFVGALWNTGTPWRSG